MPKPTQDVKWSDNANYGGGGATKIEPSSGQKDAGWAVGQKPPAQWLNWWQNSVAAWVTWLKDFEATAHTWSALQSFGSGLTAGGADGTHGLIDSLGSGNTPGVYGAAGSGATGTGVYGIGANRSTFGTPGLTGVGGNGTGANGIGASGAALLGGTGGAGAGVGGASAKGTGGAIDGSTNTTGAAGAGADFTGGAVTADANGRTGGAGVKATGGSGQAGYGYAFHGVHGGMLLEDGQIIADNNLAPHVLGSTQIDGDGTVNGDLSLIGALNGVEAKVAPTLLNSWANVGGGYSPAKYWKDKQGIVHLEGYITGGASTTNAFTLPVGYRPSDNVPFGGRSGTFGKNSSVVVQSDGQVRPSWDTADPNIILNGIIFRP